MSCVVRLHDIVANPPQGNIRVNAAVIHYRSHRPLGTLVQSTRRLQRARLRGSREAFRGRRGARQRPGERGSGGRRDGRAGGQCVDEQGAAAAAQLRCVK